jgi:TrmH family RNA methyltransferase
VVPSTQPELTLATKADVRRLRALLRDRTARDTEGVFVCEGPRLVESALDQGVELIECFVGAGGADIAARVGAAGVPVKALGAVRVGDTVTPQPVFALARLRRLDTTALAGVDLAAVAVECNDPGNAGTLLRSAAAAGAGVVVLGAGSVDAYNPKVVRASAGACFSVRIVEGVSAVEVLEELGSSGVQRLAAVAREGAAPETFALRKPTAFVLGHETRGLDPSLPLDGRVTIPMSRGESLNVAIAGSVLLFEAARQRRAA